MDKLNILLIDDEFLVRKGLTAILMQQKAVDIELRTASDAYEAMDIACNFIPDVVITDINMPEMTGLELIEKMVMKGMQCEYLIITGYERFDYAKKAMELGCVDYLVKPIVKTVLIERLEQAAARKRNAQIAALDSLRGVIFNKDMDANDRANYPSTRMLFPFKYIIIGAVLSSEMLNREILTHYFEQVVCFRQGRITVFLLNLDERISRDDISKAVSSSLGDGHLISWGNSDEMELNETLNFQMLYQQALLDAILRQYGMDPQICRAVLDLRIDDQTAIHRILLMDSKSKIKEWLRTLIDKTGNCDGYSADQVVYIYVFLLIAMLFQIYTTGYTDLQQMYRIYFTGVDGVKSQANLNTAALALIERANRQLNLSRPRSRKAYSEKIAGAIEYIEQHYREDIALTDVAEAIDMHASYLSFSFKKEVGKTYLQYLHEVRIVHACELLRKEKNSTIESIAERSGYLTANHFFHIFKEHMGMSPKEFRTFSPVDEFLVD